MTELELKKQEIAKQIVEDAQTGVSNGDYDTLGDSLTYQVRRHEEAFAEVPNMPPSKAKEVYLQRINEGFNNPREEVAKFLELSREKGGVYSSTEAANDDPFLPAGITYLVEPDDDDEVSDFKRVSGRFVTKSTDDFVENMPVYRWGQKAAAGMIGRLGDLRMPYTKEGTEAGAATLTNLATLPTNLPTSSPVTGFLGDIISVTKLEIEPPFDPLFFNNSLVKSLSNSPDLAALIILSILLAAFFLTTFST